MNTFLEANKDHYYCQNICFNVDLLNYTILNGYNLDNSNNYSAVPNCQYTFYFYHSSN